MHSKGSYASLFPQISFAADYNRTLKKQVMYMDFGMVDMGGAAACPAWHGHAEYGRRASR